MKHSFHSRFKLWRRQLLTFCLDAGRVDSEVGVPGQKSRPDDVLAEAASQPRQPCGLQVKRLPRLHGELGAAAVPQGQPVGALRVRSR